jgi:hypothetical protein
LRRTRSRHRVSGGELPGVFQQVLQDRADEATIRLDPDGLPDSEPDAAARVAALEFLGDPGGLGTEIDGVQVHLGSRYTRKAQQVVDKGRHLLAGFDDSPGVVPAFVVEDVLVVF